ncbi:hypothetical protein HG536_0H03240 [Torulaspora globosa]|uniref:Vacuolar protein sorting-associated protein 41 n=1 Tax=Torulaspora globosa TaxID=48254 RepID=A0A7G3ZN63_9SACH|nr:uncharacterized protein HG536_0H03240 [Torulaspora globosa]QLL34949.1 hypothetical protein HG536_0H03240 [Torulaspora globosa]
MEDNHGYNGVSSMPIEHKPSEIELERRGAADTGKEIIEYSDEITEKPARSNEEQPSGPEEDSESDSDEEETPPLLKYTRLNKLPTNFFNRDSISACLFQEEFFAFGTHSGLLHLTLPDFTPIQTLKLHRSSILSIHSDNIYFATGSIDGTVAIGLLEDPSNITSFDFRRPIQAVVLSEDYATHKTFVSGGMAGEVILSQRNWLGNRVDTTLVKGEGPIMGIFTIGDIILWMNDAGITFCSIHSKTQLLNVKFPNDGSDEVRPALYKPHVHFPESDRILVGWGRHIWMFKVSLKSSIDYGKNLGSILSSAASSLRAIPDKKVELEHYFQLRLQIAGVASFKDDQILCLGFDIESKENSNIPELQVIDAVSGLDVYSDEVISKNYKNLSLNDYHLGKHINQTLPEYFLISAKDSIRIQVFSLNDHYNWYLTKGNYLKAWEIGKYAVSPDERLTTGFKYVYQLLDDEQWECAVSFITSLIASNAKEGQQMDRLLEESRKVFMIFIDNGKVDSLTECIPTEPRLDKSIYDAILNYYLEERKLEKFMNCIHKWPLNVYSFQGLQDRLEEKIEKHDTFENIYRDAIIHMYLIQKLYVKAVPHMIKRKDIRVLDILLTHNLASQITLSILDLVLLPYDDSIKSLNKLSITDAQKIFQKPINLLVSNRHSFQTSKVVDTLSNPKELGLILFLYLSRLSVIDPDLTAKYENDLIGLYAEFQKGQLLEFLKRRSNYDLEKAIEFCSNRHGFHNELIYLWGKIGENKKALSLIIDELNDPNLAIEFVKNWGDADLWVFMVSYSMDKPKFIKALLDSPDQFGKTYLEVIRAMPPDLHVSGLKSTVVRISRDNALTLQVSRNVFKIIDDETREYGLEYLKYMTMGKVFHVEEKNRWKS